MKYTKEDIVDGINSKIDSMYTDDGIRQLYKDKLPQYPKEIEQNILEWVNDEPITEVDCHGESIKRTMEIWGFNDNNIPQIICGFIKFAKSNFRVSCHIWQAVKGLQCVYD